MKTFDESYTQRKMSDIKWINTKFENKIKNTKNDFIIII